MSGRLLQGTTRTLPCTIEFFFPAAKGAAPLRAPVTFSTTSGGEKGRENEIRWKAVDAKTFGAAVAAGGRGGEDVQAGAERSPGDGIRRTEQRQTARAHQSGEVADARVVSQVEGSDAQECRDSGERLAVNDDVCGPGKETLIRGSQETDALAAKFAPTASQGVKPFPVLADATTARVIREGSWTEPVGRPQFPGPAHGFLVQLCNGRGWSDCGTTGVICRCVLSILHGTKRVNMHFASGDSSEALLEACDCVARPAMRAIEAREESHGRRPGGVLCKEVGDLPTVDREAFEPATRKQREGLRFSDDGNAAACLLPQRLQGRPEADEVAESAGEENEQVVEHLGSTE